MVEYAKCRLCCYLFTGVWYVRALLVLMVVLDPSFDIPKDNMNTLVICSKWVDSYMVPSSLGRALLIL
jgi:hypothetical protein